MQFGKRVEGVVRRVRSRDLDSSLTKGIVVAVVLVLVFVLGMKVGNGSIPLPGRHVARSQNGGLPAQLDYSEVNKVYQIIKQNYNGKLTAQQLEDGMKQGL